MPPKTLAKFFIGLPGFFILASGLMFMFAPENAAAKLMLEPQSVDGWSNIRGFLGAPVIAVGASILLGAITGKLEYVRSGAIFVLALAFARILSRVVDGPYDSFGVYLAVPLVVFALLAIGHKLLVSGDGAEATAA